MEVLKLLDTSGNCERPCILTCCILTLRIKQQCTESALTEAGHYVLTASEFHGSANILASARAYSTLLGILC